VNDLIDTIATTIRTIDNSGRLNADGLGTLVMRRLHELGIIRLDQVREVSAFIAANANMDPADLAAALVTGFHLGHDHEQAIHTAVTRIFGALADVPMTVPAAATGDDEQAMHTATASIFGALDVAPLTVPAAATGADKAL
jgi:hypothetical protein